MPLPSDPQTVKVSEDLVNQLQALSGKHPGFRPVHARGILTTGTFTPTSTAASLSKAPHFQRSASKTIPVTVRFSNATGIPNIPDTSPDANPRGFGLRFHLGEHLHTDIIAHSTPLFPVNTGQGFLDFLHAIVASSTATSSPSPIEQFFGQHPAAFKFATAEKPIPSSFAREAYFGVNAFQFVNAEGKRTFARYRVVPDAGVEHLDSESVKSKGEGFLFEELPNRIRKDGKISFMLKAQLAEEGDVVDDATILWPESRPLVDLGQVLVEGLVKDDAKEQKHIIYDPIPRVEGIEPSKDPLLEVRAAAYLISGRQRRAA